MLVITRKEGESLVIGDDITITVTEIKSDTQIKIGIEAPADIPVLREELVPNHCESQNQATKSGFSGFFRRFWP